MAPGIRATLWISKINYLPLILTLIFIRPIPTTFKRLPNKSIYMSGGAGLTLISQSSRQIIYLLYSES